MEEMEKGKRYSAEDKGYTSKIYEIRWIPVTEIGRASCRERV